MPRPRKCRRVGLVPANPCFYPQMGNSDEVVLNVEEIEAIRLSDLLGMDQDEAAENMDVSRGTFQRIIKESRRKLADALINGKTIRIKGGNYCVMEQRPCCKEQGRMCRGRRCSRPDRCEGGV